MCGSETVVSTELNAANAARFTVVRLLTSRDDAREDESCSRAHWPDTKPEKKSVCVLDEASGKI